MAILSNAFNVSRKFWEISDPIKEFSFCNIDISSAS